MLPGLAGIAGLARPKNTTLTYQTATSAEDETTFSFASQAFGDAASDRVVVVTISLYDNNPVTISSVTIGGVSATIIVQASNGDSTVGIAAALVPTGTTGTIAVTASALTIGCAIGVWSCVGLTSVVAVDTDSNTNFAELTLSAEPGGFVVAACMNFGFPPGTHTWTGATEKFDAGFGAGFAASSGASDQTSGTSVSLQPSSSGSGKVFVAATF